MYSSVRLLAIALLASSPISKQFSCNMRPAITRTPLYLPYSPNRFFVQLISQPKRQKYDGQKIPIDKKNDRQKKTNSEKR